jgi:hypothetical protein
LNLHSQHVVRLGQLLDEFVDRPVVSLKFVAQFSDFLFELKPAILGFGPLFSIRFHLRLKIGVKLVELRPCCNNTVFLKCFFDLKQRK